MIAYDCHGRDIKLGDRVELELTPEDAGTVCRIERYGLATWLSVRMDDGRHICMESFKWDGSR